MSMAEAGRAAGLRFVDRAEPVPFEDVLAPLVVPAQERLARRLGARSDRLGPNAHASLEHLLLKRLSTLSARTLHLGFSTERLARLSPMERVRALSDAAPPRTAYLAFTERMLEGGLDRLLGEYPVLARLIPWVTDEWIATVLELIDRLEQDDAALVRAFGADASGRVARVEPALSDPHRGGRMVMGIEFASGLRLACAS
jgi:lantibiotic modifying enzyme